MTPRSSPPWLWVWLGGYLLATMPLEISNFRRGYTSFGPGGVLTAGVGNGVVTVERLTLIFDLLIYAVILAGAVAAMFPHLRGRWVERRFKLASDDRSVMTEMQRFVGSHDPSISLRVTIRSDQMARIYPVGWRSARIAVFRPLPVLWRRDREAAQAILLHEVAHRRQGDQLIVGLGSPFVMLMRIWVPAYLLLVLIPSTVYLGFNGNALAPVVAVFSITQAVLVPTEIFLPVTALWLAELGADQMAAQALGPSAVREALLATAGSRASLLARALALLSHPPRRLRLRLAAARPARTASLVAAWPVALAVWLLVLPVALTVPALLLLGFPADLTESSLRAATSTLLADGRPVVFATAVLLLAWPVLSYPWQRLWSSAPRQGSHQPWWPYLAAAILPVGMLVASLAPLQASLPTAVIAPTGNCTQLSHWVLGDGRAEEEHVGTDAIQFLIGRATITAAAAQRLDGEIQAALDSPPPGAARPSFTEAMTGYRAAITDLQAGNSTAANTAVNNAINQEQRFAGLLVQQTEKCGLR